uniref:SFRICE_028330 n=1 Tax=Spodoptera frugiperda TaxID=7108 RepID=A0A2H1VS00_SPOFR
MWTLLLYSVLLSSMCGEAFFHLEKPIFFCYKVCPLYCSPRRSDEDAESLIYLDDDPYSFGPSGWDESYSPYPYHIGHVIYCHPKTTTSTTTTTTTTTMKPTTEEPTWICMVCKTKCNYPKS